MKIPTGLLLRFLLAYGLMNRETFENHITALLSGYMEDPNDIEKINEFLFTQMGELKDFLTYQNIAGNNSLHSQEELRNEIAGLRKAIEALNEKIDQKKEGSL